MSTVFIVLATPLWDSDLRYMAQFSGVYASEESAADLCERGNAEGDYDYYYEERTIMP